MKKIVLACLSAVLLAPSFSQKHLNRISSDAYMVLDVEGSKLLDKVSEKNIQETFMFSDIARKLNKKGELVNKLDDLGLDFSKNFTIVSGEQEDMTYFYTLYAVKNVVKFTNFIEKSNRNRFDTILNKKGYRFYKYRYSNSYLAIGGKEAVFIESRYTGKKFNYYLGYYNDYSERRKAKEEVMDLYVQTNDFQLALKKAIELAKKMAEDREEARQKELERLENVASGKAKKQENKMVEAVEAAADAVKEVEEEAYRELPADYYQREREINDFFYQKEDEDRKKLDEQKNAYLQKLLDVKIAQLLGKKAVKKSITSIKSFKKNRDNKSVAYFWASTSDASPVMREIFGRGVLGRRYNRNRHDFSTLKGEGYGTSANFYLEDTRAYAQMKATYDKDTKEAMSKMFNKSFNKKLLPFINKNAIGYASFSLNTQAFLEEMPKIYGKVAKQSLKGYKRYGVKENYEQEIDLAVDFFQIFLDEEEVAKLFKGDMVFTLNNLEMKEVEYISYQYDDEYNRKEVTKTRKEPLPDFNFAITSANEKIITKLFKYGVSKEVFKKQGAYFAIDSKKGKLPFDVFLTYSNGVLLVSTNKNEVIKLNAGKLKANVPTDVVNMLNNNSTTVYYNNKRLFELLPKEEMVRSKRDKETFEYVKNNTEDAYFTQSVKNGDFITELSVNAPKGTENSAKYLLNLFDKIIEIQNKR